eukprot:1157357-Pelagomonas_calceolata.AAC.11
MAQLALVHNVMAQLALILCLQRCKLSCFQALPFSFIRICHCDLIPLRAFGDAGGVVGGWLGPNHPRPCLPKMAL